jgi:hypothetical protein
MLEGNKIKNATALDPFDTYFMTALHKINTTYGRTKRILPCFLFESEDYERGLTLTEGSIKPHMGG